MKTSRHQTAALLASLLFAGAASASTDGLNAIELLKPQTEIGKPLMQVLNTRKSSREFSDRKLPLQELSNLLWAAWGVNRSDSGRRTAPSASNMQEIEIYVSMAEGLYVYDAGRHVLKPVLSQDIRALTGTQDYVKAAPVNLVFVADASKMGNRTEDNIRFYSAIDSGYISQNVYLYCASEGLATVARASVDRPALATAMGLRPEQRIIIAQSVGYPK